jgi:hypothetical protein
MSGVTKNQARKAASRGGSAMAAWLNIAVAFSATSNANTATGGAPNATTAAIFRSMEPRISTGWKRSADDTSVDAVQPPQQRDRMRRAVLPVDQQVEQHEGDRDRQPGRHRQPVQHAKALGLGPHCGADRRDRQQQLQCRRTDRRQPEIAQPATPAERSRLRPGPPALETHQREKEE